MTTNRTTRGAFPLWLLVALAALAAPAAVAAAQTAPPAAQQAADLLAQFPADSGAERDRLAAGLVALGEPGLAELTRQLVPMGTGNDIAVRWALNAVAVYASRTETNRTLAEAAFVKALAAATAAEVRTFLLSQLHLVGREPAVKAAAPFLADEAMAEPAAQLMLVIRSVSARAALVAALPTATGAGQVTIVKALGQLEAVEARDAIARLAADQNVALRRQVLAALARFGDKTSYDTMTGAAKAVAFKYEPSNAVGALLDYARQLGRKNDRKTAEKVCRFVMANTDGEGLLPTKSGALAILAEAKGSSAVNDLLKAVEHPDRAYRAAALQAATRIPGPMPVKKWTDKAGKVDAERRAEIVAMLGRKGDAQALPFIRASLSAKEPAVALAAAEALAHVQGAKAVPDLVAMLKTATGDTAARVAGLLTWTIDEKHLDPLAAMLDTLPPATKAAAIGVIGARGGKRFAGRILPLTNDADPDIKAAAFGALAGVVGAADLPALLPMLDVAAGDAIAALQKAVVAAALQVTPASDRVAPIVRAMKASAAPERYMDVLPQIGGPQALAAAVESFETGSAEMKAAAFRALTRWPGTEAADRLFAIFASDDPTYRNPAFAGFVRGISASALTPEQKVLQLRRALARSSTVGDKRILLRAFERLRTFQSFLQVVPLLDDPDVANDAAGAVMRIAMPNTPGARDGLAGTLVRDALSKAMGALKGPQADADKESIRGYLAVIPAEEGFVPLFNGKDLTGWKGLVGTPITRARMSKEDLPALQAVADAKASANWSVKDGAIVFSGKGDNLCTVKDYGDFEMVVDWRITKDGDSGIYLRGSPQVQIWDPARKDVGAEVGSGGLYNNQKHPSKPLVFADNPVGEWNTFRIVMIGEKVTVFLNGVKVVDNVTMENYWDRKLPIFPRGAIELQAHGTDLAFRDIYVHEITASDPAVVEMEKKDGFVPLFNGRTLDGWVGNLTGYKVEDGAIVFDPAVKSRGNLYTAKDYADFRFRFEFQLTPGANSGVGIRAPREGDAAYVGMEIQVLDNDAPVYATLQPYQYHGSVYGVIPAQRGFLRPTGEWNSEEIFIQGSRIMVTLNGTVIVDGDIAEASKNGTMDKRDHPGLKRTSGAIGWLSHDSVVRFRNIRIKDLSGR